MSDKNDPVPGRTFPAHTNKDVFFAEGSPAAADDDYNGEEARLLADAGALPATPNPATVKFGGGDVPGGSRVSAPGTAGTGAPTSAGQIKPASPPAVSINWTPIVLVGGALVFLYLLNRRR